MPKNSKIHKGETLKRTNSAEFTGFYSFWRIFLVSTNLTRFDHLQINLGVDFGGSQGLIRIGLSSDSGLTVP